MRFVKATERLPEKFVDVIVRNTRTGRVRKEQNMGFDYAFGAGDHDFEFKETEWLDEQDEGWVPVESPPPTNEKYNESDYYLCLLESTEYVVCWYNSQDKVWRVANFKADSLPLIGITHYRKLPAPPATT